MGIFTNLVNLTPDNLAWHWLGTSHNPHAEIGGIRILESGPFLASSALFGQAAFLVMTINDHQRYRGEGLAFLLWYCWSTVLFYKIAEIRLHLFKIRSIQSA
ncbi:hypothetical protein [Herbaspirillum huttiense]|uniref:hypothetical protein n=1 Tax=Herbaspirillum huttiense TaxID=863372 RepID=UPI0039B0E9FF